MPPTPTPENDTQEPPPAPPIPLPPQWQPIVALMKGAGVSGGAMVAAFLAILGAQYLGIVPRASDITRIREEVRTVADGVNKLADAINAANQSSMSRSTFNEWVLRMQIENPQIKWVDPRTLSLSPIPLLPTIPMPPLAKIDV